MDFPPDERGKTCHNSGDAGAAVSVSAGGALIVRERINAYLSHRDPSRKITDGQFPTGDHGPAKNRWVFQGLWVALRPDTWRDDEHVNIIVDWSAREIMKNKAGVVKFVPLDVPS